MKPSVASLPTVFVIATSIAVFSAPTLALAGDVRMTVSGQVNEKDGKPQAGVRIAFTCTPTNASQKDHTGGLSAATGSDGKFQIVDVPAGECFFLVTAPWHTSGPVSGPDRATLTIQEGVDVTDLVLTSRGRLVPEPEGSVSGRVVDEAGAGLAGSAVYPECGTDCDTTGPDCVFVGASAAAPNGSFQLKLPVGPCRLRACQRDSSRKCPGGRPSGPCVVGEPCADVTVSAETPVTGLMLRRGASQP